MAEPHEETAFPKPKNCRRCGNPLGSGVTRCEVCNQEVNQEVAEPRSLLVIALIVTAVLVIGVLIAIWAINST